MKLAQKIGPIILLLLLLLVPTVAVFSAQEYPEFTNGESAVTVVSSDQGYPEFINGERVIFVQNSENTFSVDSNRVILTILDDSNSIEESMAKFSDYLANYQLPEGWSITVIGGPGASAEKCLQAHNSFNDAVKRNGGPFKLGPVPLQTSRGRTYAIDAPNDPSSETITYISAEWIAPQVGNNQNRYSALLVNGWTDQTCTDPYGNLWSGYFLQSGQLYTGGLGQHVWADTTTGFVAQPFGVPYVQGHNCQYFIAKFKSGWTMGFRNNSTGGYSYHIEPDAAGTKLVKSTDTSVFFENWNTNSNWYLGFTNPISVSNAYTGIAYPASVHPWNSEYIVIKDTYGNTQSNGIIFKIISGGLRNRGTANWNLQRILIAQPIS